MAQGNDRKGRSRKMVEGEKGEEEEGRDFFKNFKNSKCKNFKNSRIQKFINFEFSKIQNTHRIHFSKHNQKHPFSRAHKKAETLIQPEAQLTSLLVQKEQVVLQVCT